MKSALVIGSHPGSAFLANCLASIPPNWPVLVVVNGGYELGKIGWVMEHTNLEEFLFLPDSVEIKDDGWMQRCFTELAGQSVAVNCDPGPFGSFMGKYRREIIARIGVPVTATKREAIEAECQWNGRYCLEEKPVILWPGMRDGGPIVEKCGRENMLLESVGLRKFKGTWGGLP